MHALSPWVLVVNPSLQVNSAGDLIALAKSKPNELSYGSAGPGTAHHLFAEMFKSQTGIQVTHVPYKSTMQPLNDVIAGHLQFMFTDLPPSQGLIKEGKLRALGVSSKVRLAAAPDIPPLNEAGVPGFEALSWHMIAAPAGTPTEVINKLHSELKSHRGSTGREIAVRQDRVDSGRQPVARPTAGIRQSEIARWAPIVQQAGVAGMQ